MSQDDARTIESVEDMIRGGRIEAAQVVLKGINGSAIPRAFAAPMAKLARRIGLPQLTLRWLKHYVRSPLKAHDRATVAEIAEYAMGLQRFGAVTEARLRLSPLPAGEMPLVHFYLALCDIAEWNFGAAVLKLSQFIDFDQAMDAYSLNLARVNRAACWVSLNQHDLARPELEILTETFRAQKLNLLLANVLEITAQMYIQSQDFQSARRCLISTKSLIDGGAFPDQIFIQKWTAVLDAIEAKDTAPLWRFRGEALSARHWETLRDLDFYSLDISFDPDVAGWLYYGTPYPYWRERLRARRPDLSWVSRQAAPEVRVDPLTVVNGAGTVPHRFVLLLLRDFYRPARIGELFSALFPDQFFDDTTSVNRVHATAARARKWLNAEGWPARIEEQDGTYALRWETNTSILCGPNPFPGSAEMFWREILHRAFAEGPFTSAQAAEVLKLSVSQSGRSLNKLSAMGLVTRYGAAKNTHFTLNPS